MEPFDLSGLPPIPEPEVLEPITDWRSYLDDCHYDHRGQQITQTIVQVLSRNLDSGHDTLEKAEPLNIDPALLAVMPTSESVPKTGSLAEPASAVGRHSW